MWPSKSWNTLVIVITVIAVGGIVVWSLHRDSPAEIEISDPSPVGNIAGEVYVGGAVGCPGYYTLQDDDNIMTLLQAAGGVVAENPSDVEVRVVCAHCDEPQKIDINRAQAWLLEALPGIGPERAESIVTYRREVGRFQSIYELLEVDGIGPGVLEEITPLITVSD